VRRDIDAAPRLRTADISLLQEVAHEPEPQHRQPPGRQHGLFGGVFPEGPKVFDRGLAVLSKFPIEDSKVE
jgi:hypothetical protein